MKAIARHVVTAVLAAMAEPRVALTVRM